MVEPVIPTGVLVTGLSTHVARPVAGSLASTMAIDVTPTTASTVFLATEEIMDVVFMSMIPFSGEHAPSNKNVEEWAKKT